MAERERKSPARHTRSGAGLAERVDRALHAMMSGDPQSSIDSDLMGLMRIAAALRDLPRAEFKSRLAAELGSVSRPTPRRATHRRVEEVAQMPVAKQSSSEAAAQKLAPVMPFMYIRDPSGAVDFYSRVLGATELMREADPSGVVSHAQFRIGESVFMISNPASHHVGEYAQAGWARTPQELGGTPVHLYVQIPSVDKVFARALAAGAKMVHEVRDMEWGDRVGGFQDPWGHIWYVATPLPRRQSS